MAAASTESQWSLLSVGAALVKLTERPDAFGLSSPDREHFQAEVSVRRGVGSSPLPSPSPCPCRWQAAPAAQFRRPQHPNQTVDYSQLHKLMKLLTLAPR